MMIEPLDANIGQAELDALANMTSSMIESVKQHMLAPDNQKTTPLLNQTEVIILAGSTAAKWISLVKRNAAEMPTGTKINGRVFYSLAEARWIVKKLKNEPVDPKRKAVVIAVVNFKGGVTKTTTAATLAQGLSLRGLNCLCVDLDPQGSLTTLFGFLPDLDVDEKNTVIPLYYGNVATLDDAVLKTYWDGVDLIASSPGLHNAEFILPMRQKPETEFKFWDILNNGLDSLRDVYDVIVIDTPPSLSYTTVNAIIAADALIMPLPASPLDFASSVQFWNLTKEMVAKCNESSKTEKKFNFIDILLTRIDNNVGVSHQVREWILKSYLAKVLPVEIPKTSIADTAAASFGTVYDLQSSRSIAKTLKRAKVAYDLFVDHIHNQVNGVWLSRSKG